MTARTDLRVDRRLPRVGWLAQTLQIKGMIARAAGRGGGGKSSNASEVERLYGVIASGANGYTVNCR